jgi:hypothetical protein
MTIWALQELVATAKSSPLMMTPEPRDPALKPFGRALTGAPSEGR